MVLVLLYTSVLLYYYSKNKARETSTSGCAWAHPRAPSVGTWSTTQHIQKHPKKGGKPQLPVSHARHEGIPSMSRHFRSFDFRSGLIPVTSSHVTSGRSTTWIHRKYDLKTPYILLLRRLWLQER